MKSLIKKILSEEVQIKLNESQEYLDFLLDKISEEGMGSLSPKEKEDLMKLSKGEMIEPEEEEPTQPEEIEGGDLNRLFMHYALPHEEVPVDGKDYHAEITDEYSGEHIRVTGPDVDFICSPFWKGHKGIAIQTSDEQGLLYKVPKEPTNDTEMMAFVQKFYETLLPKIIRKISSMGDYQ